MLPNFSQSLVAKLQAPLFFISEVLHALYIINTQKVNFIHSHFIIPSGLVGAICTKFLRIGHLVTVHAADLFALEALPYNKQILRFIVNNTDQITVVSSHLYERLLKLVPTDMAEQVANKTKIIPMGTYTKLFRVASDKEELKLKYGIKSKVILLFVGRLAEKKGIPYLLKAMSLIISQNKEVGLLVCGDGPIRVELEGLVKQLKLEEFVTFCGFIAGQKKVDFLSLSDILIVPSIVTDSGDTEGLPVIIMEGLAAGKLVIASDVGGARDAIIDGENALLVEPKNPEQIAQKVMSLVSNNKLGKKLTESALESAKEYDWNNIGERYKQVLESIKIKT
jgi:glycosyltransferase involved in cell wall biosynthesis